MPHPPPLPKPRGAGFLRAFLQTSFAHPALLPLLLSLALGLSSSRLNADEIHSNGLGGGRWSDPATWRGGKVPTSADDAVISSRDSVLFDRDDSDKPTCKQLILDPKSMLTFQSGLGKRTLNVDGPVEIYGTFKMVAQAATDTMALQISASLSAERTLKVERGGAFLVAGRPFAPGAKPSVSVHVTAPPEGKTLASAELAVSNKGSIDLQNAWIGQVAITVTGIDNTGAKPNERCNFTGNLFTAQSQVSLVNCDSAVVARNTFEAREGSRPKAAAIRVTSSPLVDVRENRIVGPYWFGIELMFSECTVGGNQIEQCTTGIVGTRSPLLLKGNLLRKCGIGVRTTLARGSSEDLQIEECDQPALLEASTLQLSGVQVRTRPPAPGGASAAAGNPLRVVGSIVQLLNCNLEPQDVAVIHDKNAARSNPNHEPPVQALAFLVVKLSGEIPRNATVQVLTATPSSQRAQGTRDPNVRNSPAPVRADGTTPLPSTLVPLILKSWSLDEGGALLPSPSYTLQVLAPAAESGAAPVLLKSVPLKPDGSWFRSSASTPTPTLEVSLP